MKYRVEPSWSDVLIAAADDEAFWNREVRHPAVRFLADGCKGKPREPDEEDDVHGLKQE